MRLSKMSERRIEKESGREASKIGWDKVAQDEKFRLTDQKNKQRHISMGMGHHFARMMKGHI